MSSLVANSGLGLLNKMLDHLFRVQHIYRCFVNCSLVTSPVVGRRIPLSRTGLCSAYVVGLNSIVGAK